MNSSILVPRSVLFLCCAFLVAACQAQPTAPSGAIPEHSGDSQAVPDSRSPAAQDESDSDGADVSGAPIFIDLAAESGLEFRHVNGMQGERYMVEMVGAGVALLDYDRDGDLDVYLVQGHPLIEGAASNGADSAHRDRLYRNDLTTDASGQPVLRFSDATDKLGIDARGYGMGALAGDLNNDGWPDLYISNWGEDEVWINREGQGFNKLQDWIDKPSSGWSTSATFVDYDRDGWLDIYVTQYLRYSLEQNVECSSASSGHLSYCGPSAYSARNDLLYRNIGDGRFEDRTFVSGLANALGPALGVVASDLNGDGLDDLYVTHDGEENQLWIGVEGGRFEERAKITGSAVNAEGQPEASMGLVAADFDADGDEDLFMTHLVQETNTLYLNDGQGIFRDATRGSGLDGASMPFTGFGVSSLDFDNDGLPDLAIANGDVRTIEAQAEAGDPLPLRQANQLFHNQGMGRFDDWSERAGSSFERLDVSRGLATGDLDNDGDADLVLTNNDGPVELLINQVGDSRNWIGLQPLRGQVLGEDLAATVTLFADGVTLGSRRVRVDGSYASSNDPRVLFGLGDASKVDSVRVRWSDGELETWSNLEINRYHALQRGFSNSDGEDE